MKFIYIQTIATVKKAAIPFRIFIKSEAVTSSSFCFNFRPEVAIPKQTYTANKLDRLALLAAKPFCDIADDLIELFEYDELVFLEPTQFKLLKAQFKIIGYNFNIRPKYIFHKIEKIADNSVALLIENHHTYAVQSEAYGHLFIDAMAVFLSGNIPPNTVANSTINTLSNFNLARFKMRAGVYYFLDASNAVIYVGKAKNIRKRLQSHFSNSEISSGIDYSKVKDITVTYTGNDILAQLIESDQIKSLQPIYNTQQINDAAPYIINRSKTASGIAKLQITRKDIKDNMPEVYFNRISVKKSLLLFASEFKLCRKHCGLERVKGPCSNVTERHANCVCASTETIAAYNERFKDSFKIFKNRKSRKIFKLLGRQPEEDAFIYLVNDIYQGYGFIDKSDVIANENDVLGYLVAQNNNYDTSRILGDLSKKIIKENIFTLNA